jgi:hypothetical protein
MRTRNSFISIAVVGHIGFVLSLAAAQWAISQQQIHDVVRWFTYGIAALGAVLFYFNVDYFFVSTKLHRALSTRIQSGVELTARKFALTKVLVWIYILLLPGAALVFHPEFPLVVKVYGAMIYVLSLGLLSGFLFRSYDQYTVLRRQNKWGALATW